MGEAINYYSKELDEVLIASHPAFEFARAMRIGHRINMLEQYGDNSANLGMRFEVYKYAMDNKPIMHDQVFEKLAHDLQPDDTVIDVGCADRRFLAKIRRRLHHRGQLIGVDVMNMFSPVDQILAEEGLEPIEFIQQKASDLALEPGSIDKITALFVLYYDPESIYKLHEQLKDGGQLYVAVPGQDNKKRHRFWEVFATKKIRQQYRDNRDLAKLQPPPLHAAPFTADIAGPVLSELFSEVDHIPQQTFMKIDNEESLDAYRMSLYSMYPNLAPYWRIAIDNEVIPLISREIDKNGYYWDVIDRHMFIATKKAASVKAA